ncbi:MAG: glyoxalase/bleomycin resistance/dioxygenase family protein [Nitrospirae bacterium]|nr:glyoxalase/bleomycin resistance/dioxygenase family protein [Nitrospirota bacterium]
MKRFHAHISVENLSESIRFYSGLFNQRPTIEKPDYAKWMIDDPRINFAISQRGAEPGLDHLGIQVESNEELHEINQQMKTAALPVSEQLATTCCYAKSDKYWTLDPQGIAWEAFHNLETAPVYGNDFQQVNTDSACCAPTNQTQLIQPVSKACC